MRTARRGKVLLTDIHAVTLAVRVGWAALAARSDRASGYRKGSRWGGFVSCPPAYAPDEGIPGERSGNPIPQVQGPDIRGFT